MKLKGKLILMGLLLLLTAGLIAFLPTRKSIDDQILAYRVDTKKQNLQLYWKNDKGETLKSIQNLKTYVEIKNLSLSFTMNGGMFNKDFLFKKNLELLTKIHLNFSTDLSGL